MKSETLTLVLVNLAGIMQRADESLLPGVYKEVGEALHIDPTGLGSLTLFRSVVQSCCYPLAAYLAMHRNRAHVISLGAFLWAAATFLVAISTTFFQVAVSRGLNGIGLAIVIPSIQSLVADSTDESNRGWAFGWLQLTGNIGSILGGFCSVLIASKTIMGIPGWRFAFHLVGLISVIVAFIMTLFVIANSIGGLFGGRMGDILAKHLPNSGRVILSQISAGSAIPIAAVLLLALPDDPSTAFSHGLVFFIMGFFISWNAPATNNPIFAEIVPEKSRTSIYALDQSFESILASFAPPIVGILAERVYGYKPVTQGSSDSMEIETDRENAASLAKALYAATGIPMAICCLIYSLLYCTYPRDRERARMQALIESEMQQVEDNDSPSSGKQSKFCIAEEINDDDERSEIYIEFGGHESLDLDDNNDDEKSLLNHHHHQLDSQT
ncbi:Major facilitator superfamily [Corchorus olitorius]|uniref:Major facilitator superfamily n=1 Tax=Corchorus olitorius TaxID=93759 RepID=A0A1R3KAG6_9ROSI|nr:Major facilitator superfamily [Corchorus olitorius]